MGGYTKYYYLKGCLYYLDKYYRELWIGIVFIIYIIEKNDCVLLSKYMLYLNNVIIIIYY